MLVRYSSGLAVDRSQFLHEPHATHTDAPGSRFYPQNACGRACEPCRTELRYISSLGSIYLLNGHQLAACASRRASTLRHLVLLV